MRHAIALTALATCLTFFAFAAPAPAQCPGGRCPTAFVQAQAPAYAYVYATPAPQQAAPAASTAESPAGFLAALNAYRAQYRLPALAWDQALAAAAATNSGVHAPWSSGGGYQCWAGTRSYAAALSMWLASPAHRAILLGPHRLLGVSLCASGCTANAR